MKNKITYISIALLLLIASYLISHYGQPYLANTRFDFIFLDYLLIVPFMYCVGSVFSSKTKFSHKKLFLLTTVIAMCYILLSDFMNPTNLLGKASAGLIGAAISFFVLICLKTKQKAR